MVQYHKRSKTKASGSGGHRRAAADKRKAHWGGFFAHVKLGTAHVVNSFRMQGGRQKAAVHFALYANVSDGKSVKKTKILTVKQSPDNRHFARENVITQGSVIDTELGLAKVTSRPGQHGVINAVLQGKPKA